MKTVLKLTGAQARQAAIEAIRNAPVDYIVRVGPPTRTLEQNSALWPRLNCWSKQLPWNVNEAKVTLTDEEWKDILSAAFEKETLRMADGLHGGLVMLGRRTSQYDKYRFSEFLDFIDSEGVELGIVPDDYRENR